jgi:hypothetical protein
VESTKSKPFVGKTFDEIAKEIREKPHGDPLRSSVEEGFLWKVEEPT